MNKVICDICGTTYPEIAEQCPICGCSRDVGGQLRADDILTGDGQGSASGSRGKGGRFSASAVRKRNKNEIQPIEDDEYDTDDYEEEYEEAHPVLVVLLIVVIAALLVTTGIIFVKYLLPNVLPQQEGNISTVDTMETLDSTEQTTEPTIPCTSLALTSGAAVDLTQAGQNWLLNVVILPENTTDALTYISSDEAVATVNEEGRVTAVGEGEATITITCGEEQMECVITCTFAEDTVEETEETTEATEALPDVTLWLNYTDLTLTSKNDVIKLKFNEELTADQIQWISEDPTIATVENGVISAVGHGMTNIIARYGDQEVVCIVRCTF